MSKTGPSAINRIAGVTPCTILAATTTTGLKGYALQLGSGATLSACTGTDPNGAAYDFVASNNWDAATSDFLLVAGEGYEINSVTTSGGVSALY